MYPEEVLSALDQLNGDVVVRETDCDAITRFLATMTEASLHVEIDGQVADIPMEVGQLISGEFLLPWCSDSISDVMTDGNTYLEVGGRRVFFGSVRELFYGDHKTFIACTPSSHE